MKKLINSIYLSCNKVINYLIGTKLELTEREQQFENCILCILAQKETKKQLKIELTSTTVILINKKKRIKIKLDSTGITIHNLKSVFKERLSDKTINHLKDMVIKNINQETDEELLEMDKKEFEFLEKINCLF